MALVAIKNVIFQNNPCKFTDPLRIRIFFQAYQPVPEELVWRLLYIGCPKDESHDQILDEFSIGPLQPGSMQFTLESHPPDHTRIPSREDLLGVTAIMLSVMYRKQQFFRAGFYVYNYQVEEQDCSAPDIQPVDILTVQRNVLTDKPRIFRYEIAWDAADSKSRNGLSPLMTAEDSPSLEEARL